MNLHQKYIKRVEAVNNSSTVQEHDINYGLLTAWIDGVNAAGAKLFCTRADQYYMERGINRPMCAGVWLDWEPKNDIS